MSKPYAGRHPVLAPDLAGRGLSSSDVSRVARAIANDTGGTPQNLAAAKHQLDELGCKPGCVVTRDHHTLVYLGLTSRRMAKFRNPETFASIDLLVFASGEPCTRENFLLTVVETPFDGFLHSAHAFHKAAAELARQDLRVNNAGQKARALFERGLTAEQVRRGLYGTYWQTDAFTRLLPSFVASLTRHA